MRSASHALSLPWMDIDFITTIHHSCNTEYSPYVYSQGQSCGPEEATILELLRALSRIPLHRRLRSSSNSATSSAAERRVYACRSNDEKKNVAEVMGQKCLVYYA